MVIIIVNIIIPAYNCSDTLQATLGSLVAQTNKYFFTTIVDDCSTEDLGPIIDKFDPLLNLYYLQCEENRGPGMARQVGLDYLYKAPVHCDYVMFLDSDDMLLPNAIDLLNQEIQLNTADVIYSNIYQENRFKEGVVLKIGKNTTWMGGKIYSTNFLQKYNIRFIPELRGNEDAYFNLIVAFLAENKKSINETLYFWRDYKKSLTRVSDDFVTKYNFQYLMAQVLAAEKVLEYKEDCDLGATVANIYKAYELECIVHPENIPDANDLIKGLYANKKFQNLFKTMTLAIIKDLPQTVVINQQIYFYRHSFSSFTSFFGIKMGD